MTDQDKATVKGEYIQTPESTEFSKIDPRTERDKLTAILEERLGTVPKGLDIQWTFRLKGEKRPLARTKPGGKPINRWEIIELGDEKYVVIDKTNTQIDGNRYNIDIVLEKFDSDKHKSVTERVRY